MNKIPFTVFDVLGFTIFRYEQRFLGHIRNISKLTPHLCLPSTMKLILMVKQFYSGSLQPFEIQEDWNEHKAGDIAILDVKESHSCFYIIDQKNIIDILSTPTQFRYGYKVLYDVNRENFGIDTKQIASIKYTEWSSIDTMADDMSFHQPLPLWQTYQIEVRIDPRLSTKEMYHIKEGDKWVKIIPTHKQRKAEYPPYYNLIAYIPDS